MNNKFSGYHNLVKKNLLFFVLLVLSTVVVLRESTELFTKMSDVYELEIKDKSGFSKYRDLNGLGLLLITYVVNLLNSESSGIIIFSNNFL